MLRATSIVIAVFFLFFFFFFGIGGNPAYFFKVFFPPRFLAVFLLIILFISFYRKVKGRIHTISDFVMQFRYFLFPVWAFACTLGMTWAIFGGVPHVQDAIHYLFMAENFARFKLSVPMPQYYEFFDYVFMLADGEKLYSLFMPGFSLFLVPFVWLHITWLANPLLIALMVLLAGKVADQLFGKKASLYTLFLISFSPFMLIMGGDLLVHPLCAVLSLTVIYLIEKKKETPGAGTLLMSGFILGFLGIVRPQNGLFMVIVTIPWVFYRWKHVRLSMFAYIGAGIIPWVLAIGWYNWHFTGSPFLFIQDAYFNRIDPVRFCHNFGFGKGCPTVNAMFGTPEKLFTFADAWWQTFLRAGQLVFSLFIYPLLFLLPVFALVQKGSNEEKAGKLLCAVLFVLPVILYFFFYFNGNVYGPRYYYEGSVFLLILAGKGVASLPQLEKMGVEFRKILITSFSVATAAFFIVMLFFLPDIYIPGYWGVNPSLKQAVEEKGYTNSIFFLEGDFYQLFLSHYGSGLIAMDLTDFSKRNIFAFDLGNCADSALVYAYPGRTAYKVRFDPLKNRPPEFFIFHPTCSEGELETEFEAKLFPLKPDVRFCTLYPFASFAQPHIAVPDNLFQEPVPWLGLLCRFDSQSEQYVFGQNIRVPGKYAARFIIVSGPLMQEMTFSVDSVPVARINAYSPQYEMKEVAFTLDLEMGFHYLSFSPASVPPSAGIYLLLDRMNLTLLP